MSKMLYSEWLVGQRDAQLLPADARILAVGMAMFSVRLG